MSFEQDSNDQRRLPRRHLIYYLRVFDRDSELLLGNLVDISIRGVMLVCEQPVEIGRVCRMRMILPDSGEVQFTGICRWCRNDVNPDLYDAGFELLEFEDHFFDALDRLLEEFAFGNEMPDSSLS